jgi:hypothetical protein
MHYDRIATYESLENSDNESTVLGYISNSSNNLISVVTKKMNGTYGLYNTKISENWIVDTLIERDSVRSMDFPLYPLYSNPVIYNDSGTFSRWNYAGPGDTVGHEYFVDYNNYLEIIGWSPDGRITLIERTGKNYRLLKFNSFDYTYNEINNLNKSEIEHKLTEMAIERTVLIVQSDEFIYELINHGQNQLTVKGLNKKYTYIIDKLNSELDYLDGIDYSVDLIPSIDPFHPHRLALLIIETTDGSRDLFAVLFCDLISAKCGCSKDIIEKVIVESE